jgi:hypothetical protein
MGKEVGRHHQNVSQERSQNDLIITVCSSGLRLTVPERTVHFLLKAIINFVSNILYDRLCGLMAADPEVPSSIPGAARFSE